MSTNARFNTRLARTHAPFNTSDAMLFYPCGKQHFRIVANKKVALSGLGRKWYENVDKKNR